MLLEGTFSTSASTNNDKIELIRNVCHEVDHFPPIRWRNVLGGLVISSTSRT